MREILFRGKRVDNGEWIEGLYNVGYFPFDGQNIAYIKQYMERNDKHIPSGEYEVIPETIGQYTGLADKNGKKIFEGDILKCHYDELYPDDYCYEEVVWKYNGWCRRKKNGYDAFDEDGVIKYGEVVGNIHDNPELLGGEPSEAESEDSDIITVYPHGTEISVIGTDGGSWWEVYDGERQGWVHKDYMVDAPDKYALGKYLGVFWTTGYTPNPAENGGYTTTCLKDDLWSNVGKIVAVDPSVISLNRTLYIEGIGYRRTRDTGVRGRVIDVLTGSDAESDAITANRKVWLVE